MARNLSPLLILVACFVCCCLSLREATEILVGGKEDAWKIPSSKSHSLNYWAERTRFIIGDTLVWKYDRQKDSVLQVSEDDYATCNTTNPMKEYKDGNTKLMLDHSGPYYFISGAEGHCQNGQKLIVVVLSPKHWDTGMSPALSPAPESQPQNPVAPTSDAAGCHGILFPGLLALLGLIVVLM